MPTIPRRWPSEVETERLEAIRMAEESLQILELAQSTLDAARQRLNNNQSLALILVTDIQRYLSDALARVERVRRYLALARGKAISGRWPQGVTKQRDDAERALETAGELLDAAELKLETLREKVSNNPALSEAIIADVALNLARARTWIERMVRLLIEAGLGRE